MARSETAHEVGPTGADERLLIEAAQRDRARFADVYERYFALVYGYVARRVRDRAVTEDLTSEVFRKALASIDRFKWKGAPFGAWLLRIASNLIASRAKYTWRAPGDPDPSSAIGSPYDSRTPESQQQLEEAERRARVICMIDELPEDQRRVVAMRFAEDKSIREISNELGRSEGAVKQLQFRALQNLRVKLADER